MYQKSFNRFWRSLTRREKRDFATRVPCALTTLSAISYGTKLPSPDLAEKIRQAANGELDGVDLRPPELVAKLRKPRKPQLSD